MVKSMKRLTIFTPTYNRAYILPKLYESLCAQTCQDFEWLIVDDGSTDNTREQVEGWMKEDKITLLYFQQENGGKMRAYNKAVSLTDTELFVCIDSDDQLATENVVKDSLKYWDGHKNDISDKRIAGMVSVRKVGSKEADFTKIPHVGCLNSIIGAINGETTIFIQTEVLKHHPYPSFEGENFITDVYIFDQMDEKYVFLFHPYFSQQCAYQKDGYTFNYRRLLYDNPRGHREYHAQRVRLKKEDWIKSVICYISMSLFVRDHTLFSKSPNLFMTVLLYPLGCLKYLYDRLMLLSERSN